MKQPLHVALNNFYELGILESDSVNPRKQRSAMNAVTKAVVCAIVHFTYKEKLFYLCPGCVIDSCGQRSHVCLTWQDEYLNQVLKHVCSKLRMESVLYIITVVACAIQCFSMNKEHVVKIARYVDIISCSDSPQDTLNNLMKKCDKRIMDLASAYVKKRDYKSFQIHCDNCKDLC